MKSLALYEDISLLFVTRKRKMTSFFFQELFQALSKLEYYEMRPKDSTGAVFISHLCADHQQDAHIFFHPC